LLRLLLFCSTACPDADETAVDGAKSGSKSFLFISLASAVGRVFFPPVQRQGDESNGQDCCCSEIVS
jgi:hypothetical protein